jgi:two-component system sensor histidine kinase KdpD
VRRADQLELVDMSPEAIRRRMAHGNIYPPERVDAALSNWFRPGNLGALRELALLWVADRVEESLSDYLDHHGITDAWETRERIVVGITGRPGGQTLIRRASRMAGRLKGDLVGVHVSGNDGLAADGADETTTELVSQRRLLKELGGTVHEVAGTAKAETLIAFARAEKATQLVLGASRRSRWHELWHGSFIAKVTRLAGDMDVHVIANEEPADASRSRPVRTSSVAALRRRAVAWGLCVLGIPLLTVLMAGVRDRVELSTVLLTFLTLVLVISAVGGRVVAAVAAVASSLVVNWYFVEPLYTFTINEPENIVALVVFIAVAVTVGSLVDAVSRRASEALRARVEAEALARSAARLAADPDPLPALLDQLRVTFELSCARIVGVAGATPGTDPTVLARSGEPDGSLPSASVPFDADANHAGPYVLELYGRTLSNDDRRLLRVLADQLAVALDAQRLAHDAAEASALAEVDAVRTALLRAVSHDLRTPLASIKAMVSGLRDGSVAWTAAQTAEALATVDEETDRLNRLVGNLLDASRLQIGALAVQLRDAELLESIDAALHSASIPRDAVDVCVPVDLPLVRCDVALLERAVANIISNAVRHSPAPRSVRITAGVVGSSVHLCVIDAGPGIPLAQRSRVLAPFQRLGDDHSSEGVGLGLAIAQGFIESMEGTLTLDDSPGGGLTVTLTVPIAEAGGRS